MVTLAAFVFLVIVGIAVLSAIFGFVASGPGTFTWREARELTRKRHAEEHEREAQIGKVSDTKPAWLDPADGPGI